MKKASTLSPKKISAVSVAVDSVLAAVKLSVGSVTGSHALLSDGIHSCADIFSSLIVLIGSILSRSEKQYRLSAQKAEALSLFLLSVLLGTTGFFIGFSGLFSIIGDSEAAFVPPYALCVSIFALTAKEAMFFLTMKIAKRENDDILLANAWHHQSDALSCLGSFGGILMARLGFPKFDSVASIAICVFIVKTAADIFKRAVHCAARAETNNEQKVGRVQNEQK